MEMINNKDQQTPEGILLIDKLATWTSFDVVAKIRRLTKVKKVGHAGTLDPLATGLLIVLVGKKYTRIQDQFLKQDKSYLCTAIIGLETDSYDVDGQVVTKFEWSDYSDLTQTKIEQALGQFRGKIMQTVPAFSAIKKNGKKLYELAREQQIETKDLPSREVEIHNLELLSFKKDENKKVMEIEISVSCQSGTYIRSLVHDLGKALGVAATVKELRRTRIGDFDVKDAQLITDELQFIKK